MLAWLTTIAKGELCIEFLFHNNYPFSKWVYSFIYILAKQIKYMKQFWTKLKKRWEIDNDWQVLLILIIFAMTGSSTLVVHREIDLMLGITDDSAFHLKFFTFLFLVFPIFNSILYVYGLILGQRKFFNVFFLKKWQLMKRVGQIFKSIFG